jgi:SH3-like domain-containing protein
MKRLVAILFLLTATTAFAAQEQSILNPSGQPIPRFVSLKFDEVNVRVGPGKRYPIHYVYKRIHLPVQVVEEFAHWRKVADFEGSSGWVHKGAIDGHRTAIIIGKTQALYDDPDPASSVELQAQAHVIGEVKRCEQDWCQLVIQGRKGWIRKADIWGVDRAEVFKN